MRTRRSQSSGDLMSSAKSGGHQSVLLHEAIDFLAIQKDDIALDATLGGAGHAKTIVESLGKRGTFVGIDLDSEAIERARSELPGSLPTVHIVEGNFRDLQSHLSKLGISHIDRALFDLGWSSYQLDSGRGFSFLKDDPLSMKYGNQPNGPSASTIVNDWAVESIADVLFGWGEERYSRRIAKAIGEYRKYKRIETSRELAEIIKKAVPPAYRFGRIHPATRTFQALRIAVNDELGALREGLRAAWSALSVGGRIAVITFHSIEDREVKRMFAGWAKERVGVLVNRKPITPSEEETSRNPRSRSAKLRVIEKITTHTS